MWMVTPSPGAAVMGDGVDFNDQRRSCSRLEEIAYIAARCRRSVEQRAANPWRLKGSDDLEVVADEDVVRPFYADIVNLVLAVTQLHNPIDNTPRVVSQRSFDRLVRFRSADDRTRPLTVIGWDLTDLLYRGRCTALEGDHSCCRGSRRSALVSSLHDNLAGRDSRSVDHPEYENAVAFCNGTRGPLPVFRRGRLIDDHLQTRRCRDCKARCGHAVDRADYSPCGRPRASVGFPAAGHALRRYRRGKSDYCHDHDDRGADNDEPGEQPGEHWVIPFVVD